MLKVDKKEKKILIAAGGTGGHLFPAQALAKEIVSSKKSVQVLFAGAGLATNRYFHREIFSFEEVSSSSPFRGRAAQLLSVCWLILKGVQKSLQILGRFKPDLVVGFGSFHSFPLLVAAVCKRVPILIFESNVIPGRVNRLFSHFSILSCAQFAEAQERLLGPTVEVSMPFWVREQKRAPTKEEARSYFGLQPDLFTLLVFGGSQGAASINRVVVEFAALLAKEGHKFQVVHIAGSKNEESVKTAYASYASYASLDIPVCVKGFEEEMAFAWRAADLVICRSGAATLAELVIFEVPAILIPFPRASEDHQRKNAEFMEKTVKGAVTLLESDLTKEQLFKSIVPLLDPQSKKLDAMRSSIKLFKQQEKTKKDLKSVVLELLESNG